jgi:catechol 2,3-dioxygenase-like lactoylglutathione lyase family enzyme
VAMWCAMKLTFLYQRVADLEAALTFYRDELGWDEAWREGGNTVAFWLPGKVAQLMLSDTDQPAGPMYLVDDVKAWMSEHPRVTVAIPPYEIPGGAVAGFTDAEGSVFYVFDQPDA